MKKIELIWREILDEGIINPIFEQKKLAKKFGLSTSTVFAAIKPLRTFVISPPMKEDFVDPLWHRSLLLNRFFHPPY